MRKQTGMGTTAIIGGGAAGLLAAIGAAERGIPVVLFEKSDRLGGRAITTDKQGVRLNLGGHALYRKGAAWSILQKMGIRLEGAAPASRMLALWNQQIMPIPAGFGSLISSKLLSWRGKLAWMRLMVGLMMRSPSTAPQQTVRGWAEEQIPDPMVRHLFYALCRTSTYVMDPDHLLAGPALAQIRRSMQGVVYLHGGWQTIIDQLRDRAIRAGVQIWMGKSVEKVHCEGGRVHRLGLSDGQQMDVANVILAVSPEACVKLVQGTENLALKRWQSELKPSLAACLDLGLRKLPVQGHDFAIGVDLPVFFSHHSYKARLSDHGERVVHLVKYHTPGTVDSEADERLLTGTMNRLQPGWEKEVVVRQYLPRITVAHGYPCVGRTDQEIGPEVPGTLGLYVAGDWAGHGEFLLDAAAASAIRAAKAVRV